MRGLLRNYLLRAGRFPLGIPMAQPIAKVLLCVTQMYLQLDLVILKVFSHLNDFVIL